MDPGDPRAARPASAAAAAAAASPRKPPAPHDPSSAASAPLCEIFDAEPDLDPRLVWVNRPAAATFSSSTGVVPLPGADWWSNTARQPRAAAADGAFLGALFTGAFDATASVTMHHRHDWDQAGLMLHAGPGDWLKINAERVPGGGLVLATAVTARGWTDLATFPLPPDEAGGGGGGGGGGVTARLVFRIRRSADGDVALAWAPCGDGGADLASPRPAWRRVRLAHLGGDGGSGDGADAGPVRVGPYALAPVKAGFIANFRWVRVDAARGGVTDD